MLVLSQAHNRSRLSDSVKSGNALSTVHNAAEKEENQAPNVSSSRRFCGKVAPAMAIRSLLLFAALASRVTGQVVACDVPLELVLLIDTSGSASDSYCVTSSSYACTGAPIANPCPDVCARECTGPCGPGGAAIRNFVQILKDLFAISESAVRVSVIQFPAPSTAGESPFPPIERQPLTGNAATLSAAIDQISDPQGGTNIGAALRLARTDAFNSARQGVPRAVMLIADGEQSADLSPSPKDAADALKGEGVQVLTAGFAGATLSTLQQACAMRGSSPAQPPRPSHTPCSPPQPTSQPASRGRSPQPAVSPWPTLPSPCRQVASVPAGAFEAQELDAMQTYLRDNFCRLVSPPRTPVLDVLVQPSRFRMARRLQPACPAGFQNYGGDITSSNKLWSWPGGLGPCAALCDARSSCTAFEYNFGGSENFKCGVYLGSRPGAPAQAGGWQACIRPCSSFTCPSNQYRSGSCSGATNAYQCNTCSNINCPSNQYRSGSCSGTTNGYQCNTYPSPSLPPPSPSPPPPPPPPPSSPLPLLSPPPPRQRVRDMCHCEMELLLILRCILS